MQVPASTTVVIPGTAQAIAATPTPVAPETLLAPPQATETPKPDPASANLEIFAKKEAALFKQRQALEEDRRKMEEKAARLKKYEDLETNKPDPIQLLMAHGYTYEDATNFVLAGNKNTPELEVKQVKEELAKHKKELADKELKAKEEQERQAQAQREQSLLDFKVEIHDFITENSEAYELTNLYDAHDLVFNVIDEHWKKQIEDKVERPKILSTKEAAEMTEKYLEDLVDKTFETKKWASRFEPKLSAKKQPTTPSGKAPTTPVSKSTTLNNQMDGSASPSMLPAKNETDRIARALAALDQQ